MICSQIREIAARNNSKGGVARHCRVQPRNWGAALPLRPFGPGGGFAGGARYERQSRKPNVPYDRSIVSPAPSFLRRTHCQVGSERAIILQRIAAGCAETPSSSQGEFVCACFIRLFRRLRCWLVPLRSRKQATPTGRSR